MRARDARPGDARAIAETHVASWHAAYRGVISDAALDELTVESLEPRWLAEVVSPKDEASTVAVVEVEGRIAGYSRFGPALDDDLDPGATGEVYGFYLHPDLWGRGAGRALMEHVIGDLRARGFDLGVLWVVQANDRAQGFYRALGWAPDGRDDKLCIDAPEFRFRRELS